MLARAEAGGVNFVPSGTQPAPAPAPADEPQRPEWMPEKFWDPKDVDGSHRKMADAYAELERARSKPAAGNEPPAGDTPPVEGDPAAAAVQKAGLSMDELQTEFAEHGALTPESYKKLEAAGFGRDVVDAHIAGQHALAEKIQTEAYSLAGGSQESFAKMQEWAAANLSPAEIESYNAMVDGNVGQMRLAVAGMYSRYTAAVGVEPKLEMGGNAPALAAAGYESMQQMVADMKDPRYQKDPAFRAAVERKTRAAKF